MSKSRVPEPWATHIKEVIAQIEDGANRALILRGRASLIDAELESMRKHLSTLGSMLGRQFEVETPQLTVEADGVFLTKGQ